MDAKLKDKWVKALRSGEYRQGVGMLQNSAEEFCCLGVLCSIAEIHIDGTACIDEDGKYLAYGPIHDLGLDEKACGDLWGMNDRQKKSFAEIADYIEKNI